jgi:putative membrane protein
MLRILGYFVANVIVVLLLNFFPNITVDLVPAALFVLLLTLLNWTVNPFIKLLALPINFLTFGLVNGIINLAIIMIMLNVIGGIQIEATFWETVLFSLFIIVGFGIAQGRVNRMTDDDE